LIFWENKQAELRKQGVTIEYNFYASYHGHNACDAAAYHCKSLLKNSQLAYNIPVSGQLDMVGLFQSLKHSRTSLAPKDDSKRPKYKTMTKICSYHRFLFPQPGTIIGYLSSDVSEQPHNFCTKGLLK